MKGYNALVKAGAKPVYIKGEIGTKYNNIFDLKSKVTMQYNRFLGIYILMFCSIVGMTYMFEIYCAALFVCFIILCNTWMNGDNECDSSVLKPN